MKQTTKGEMLNLNQNHRQKAFSRGALPLCRGVGILKFNKTPLICSVSYFNLGWLGALFKGLSPPKPLVATGLCWTRGSQSLMQTCTKFCEVFALKFASFSLSTKWFGVICRSRNYLYHLSSHQTFTVFCLFASENKKNHYFEVQVHKCKGHLKLFCS